VARLEPLSEDQLVAILTEPKNALVSQYRKLFELDDVRLTFTPAALREVAAEALERKVGARGLRAILEEVMLDAFYELPAPVEEIKITPRIIRERLNPVKEARRGSGGKKAASPDEAA
jgi:ATP-dependent Clp protease ATP-binding subunit ClpX